MPPQTWVPTLVVTSLIGFLLFRRLRATFGRQPVAPRRIVVRIVLISVAGALIVVRLSTMAGLYCALVGVVTGVGLATVALVRTKFEVNEDGSFFVPDKWIGSAVTALFLGRLATRMFHLAERTGPLGSADSASAGLYGSPLTVGLFFVLAGFYVSYYAGVLRTSSRPSAVARSPAH